MKARKIRKWRIPLCGKWLDRMAVQYGIKRNPGEHDEALRERVVKEIEKSYL